MRIRAVLVIILSLLVLVIALISGSVLLTRLFFVGITLITFSYLWSSLSLRGIDVQLKRLTEHPQVGSFFDEAITVKNRLSVPKIMVLVHEEGNLPNYKNGQVVSLRGKGTLSWQSHYFCCSRGKYSLGPVSVETGDPFGLFPGSLKFGEAESITIYPATFELPLAVTLDGEKASQGKITSGMSEAIPNVSRIREYSSSDNLSRIHWHSTAHTGKLMVKVFDGEWAELALASRRARGGVSGGVWVIPDMQKNSDEVSEELCVAVAASLAKRFVDSAKMVGLLMHGDRFYSLPPEPGEEPYLRIMEALAEVKSGRKVPIFRLISEYANQMYPGASAFVITTATDSETQQALRRLYGEGVLTTLMLVKHHSLVDTPEVQDAVLNLTSGGIVTYIASYGERGTVGSNAFRLPIGESEKELKVWRVTRKERELKPIR